MLNDEKNPLTLNELYNANSIVKKAFILSTQGTNWDIIEKPFKQYPPKIGY